MYYRLTVSSPCEPNGSAELKIAYNTLDFTSADCMQSPNTIDGSIVIIATNLGCLYVRKKVNFDFQLNLLLPKLKSFGMIRQETELITFEHAQCSP